MSAPGSVLAFRRRGVVTRHRRRSRVLALAGPLLTALLLVGGPLAFGHWLLTSPSFALAEVRIEGTEIVSRGWVAAALARYRGQNLILLPLRDLEGQLVRHPWIGGVALTKELPDRLRVTVEERHPAALWDRGDGIFYVDPGGRVIAPVDPALPDEGWLRVRGGGPGRREVAGALAVAEELARAAPDWRLSLEEIELVGERDFRLTVGALSFPLLVRADELAAKTPYLRQLLPQLEGRYPGVARVDLRFFRRIVVEPAAAAAGNQGA